VRRLAAEGAAAPGARCGSVARMRRRPAVQGRGRRGAVVRGCGTAAWRLGVGQGGARWGGRAAAAGRDGDEAERWPATEMRGADVAWR
jgi:hypothetical protein